ncbi:MAG: RuBisCO large subunit C-terminal-like domain-containing protein [Actinobacteria bacterium]|nr:RuBisCO large subunit C-terminal-like domain-containing protein [Actinomycetota bacterium]
MNKEENIQPLALPEETYEGDYIIASYFFRSTKDADIYEKAKSFAIGQTLGTWLPVPGITNEMRKKYGGRITAIYDIPPAELTGDVPEETAHIIQIAFPDENFGAQFPMLFTTLLGNDVSTSAQVKLIDLKFSKKFLSHFKGPRYGIDRLYKYFGIQKRPIVLNMIKPCLGYTPGEGAMIFKEIASGGIDLIKDDELFADTSYGPLVERVKSYTKAAREVEKETGHLARYCVNITDRQDKMIEHAHRAVDAGAGALLVNFVATGLGALQALAEDPAITVPLVAHYASVGAMSESPYTGISTPLMLGKLARIAGADVCMFSSPYSTYPFLKRRYFQIADAQRLPLYDVLPTMPLIGGGITPNSARRITVDLGSEIMLAVGGAILGHPMGPAHGAKAIMQTVKALADGTDIDELAKQKGNEALRIALDKWK